MTKKDFIALADALRSSRPVQDQAFDAYEHNLQLAQWRLVRSAISDYCATDNPRFDVAHFIAWTEK